MNIHYKGYEISKEWDEEAQLFHGRILHINDVITFQGKTNEEYLEDVREGIRDYEEWNTLTISLTSTGEDILVIPEDEQTLDWITDNKVGDKYSSFLKHIPVPTNLSIKGYDGVILRDSAYSKEVGTNLIWVPSESTLLAVQCNCSELTLDRILDKEYPFKSLLVWVNRYSGGIPLCKLPTIIKKNVPLKFEINRRTKKCSEPFSFQKELNI